MQVCRLLTAGFVVTALSTMTCSAQSVSFRTNYFKVTGTNFHEIRRSITKSRPFREEFDALTSWQVSWKFSMLSTDAGCRCKSFSTTTQIVITMPWWVAPTNATAETKKRWSEYFQQLAAHEVGHARIAFSANAEVRRQLSQFTTDADCESLKARMNEAANRVVNEHRQREVEFDRRTRHGAEPDKP